MEAANFQELRAVFDGYPNLTRYKTFFLIPNPTRLRFQNPWVGGNPKYRVVTDILGKSEVLGIPRWDGVFQVCHYRNQALEPTKKELRGQKCEKSSNSWPNSQTFPKYP